MQTVLGDPYVARTGGLREVLVELAEPALRRRMAARQARYHEVVQAAKRAQAYDSATPEVQQMMLAFLPSEATCDAALRVESRPLAIDLGLIMSLVWPAIDSHYPFQYRPLRLNHVGFHGGGTKGLSDGYWSGTLGRVRWRPRSTEAKPNLEFSVTMEQPDIARVTHEANRALSNAMGDFSQLCWEEAPEIIRQSALTGVRSLLSDPTKTPADMHAAWVRYKIDEGWVLGAERNTEAKTHPMLVPFDELPAQDQARDWLFRAIVLACAQIRIPDPRVIEADRALQAAREADEAAKRAAAAERERQEREEKQRLADDANAQAAADHKRALAAQAQALAAEQQSQAQAEANARLVTSVEADAVRVGMVAEIARDSGVVSQGPSTDGLVPDPPSEPAQP